MCGAPGSIRHPKDFSTTVRLTATLAMDIFMKILHEYREGEGARFGQKYVEKWRRALGTKNVGDRRDVPRFLQATEPKEELVNVRSVPTFPEL
jgi:hypothetical protein